MQLSPPSHQTYTRQRLSQESSRIEPTSSNQAHIFFRYPAGSSPGMGALLANRFAEVLKLEQEA